MPEQYLRTLHWQWWYKGSPYQNVFAMENCQRWGCGHQRYCIPHNPCFLAINHVLHHYREHHGCSQSQWCRVIINWKGMYDRMGGTTTGTPIPSSMTMTALATNSTVNRSQIICRNCKHRGHMERDCYWPGGGKEGQLPPNFGKRGGNSLNNSNSNVSSTNAAKVFALTTYFKYQSNSWMYSPQLCHHWLLFPRSFRLQTLQ